MLEYVRLGFFTFTSGYAPRGLKGHCVKRKGGVDTAFIILALKKYLGAISLGRRVVPSPKKVIHLPLTYEKIYCKRKPCR